MSALTVLRADVVALCVALGYKTAASWNKKRMNGKMKDLAELVSDDPTVAVGEDVDDHEMLNALLKRIGESGGAIEVVQELPEETPKEMLPDEPDGDSPDEVEDTDAEPEEETAKPDKKLEKKVKADKPKVEKKPSKGNRPVSDAGPDLGKVVGVRSVKNRRFVAGIVIRETGLEKGVTDEMIALVDKRYGQSNPAASRSQLTDAWHAVNGYVNG